MQYVALEATLAWATLEDRVRSCAGRTRFEWRMNEGPDCLQFDNVAATFRNGYRVRFAPRPRTPTGILIDGSQFAAEEWKLEPRAAGNSVVWSRQCAQGPHRDFSPERLAKEIVERLVRYHEEYTNACMP
jgi:hypothetical protein